MLPNARGFGLQGYDVNKFGSWHDTLALKTSSGRNAYSFRAPVTGFTHPDGKMLRLTNVAFRYSQESPFLWLRSGTFIFLRRLT